MLEAILAHHRDSLSPAEVAVTCGWVGQILERQGWSERAAENFEKALEADPEHVPSLRGMARTLQARGDWPRAAGLLERLLRMPEVQADQPAPPSSTSSSARCSGTAWGTRSWRSTTSSWPSTPTPGS